jgi:RNA polymerase primary sigma factor
MDAPDESITNFAASPRLYATDAKGDTPLHIAARTGNLALCDLFIRSGADAAALNHERQTASDVARTEGHAVVARLLSALVGGPSEFETFGESDRTDESEAALDTTRTAPEGNQYSVEESEQIGPLQNLNDQHTITSWTDDRVVRLKRMWAEGRSAAQIAIEMGGVSRNDVLRRLDRLSLLNTPRAGSNHEVDLGHTAHREASSPSTVENGSGSVREQVVDPDTQDLEATGTAALREWHDGTFWNEERVELVRQMWSDGQAANQIARRLGGILTPGAVLHKLHQLGIHDSQNRKTTSSDSKIGVMPPPSARPADTPPSQDNATANRTRASGQLVGIDDLLSFEAEEEPEDFFEQTASTAASGTFVVLASQTPGVSDHAEGDWDLDITPAQIVGEGIGRGNGTTAVQGTDHDFLKVRNRGRQSIKRAVLQTGTRLSIDHELCVVRADEIHANGRFTSDDIDSLVADCEGNGESAELHINLQRNLEVAGFQIADPDSDKEYGLWDIASDVTADELAESIEAALSRETALPGTQRFVMDKSNELRLLEPMVRAKQELQLSLLASEHAVEKILDVFDMVWKRSRDPGTVTLRTIFPSRAAHTETSEVLTATEVLKSWQTGGRVMDGKRRREALAALEALDLSLSFQKEIARSVAESSASEERTSGLLMRISVFEAATEDLILEHLPYVRRFSARHVEDGEDPEDVFQVAFTGLQRSTRRFDPERGIRFVVYCTFWMKQALARWRADEGTIIRVPAHRHQHLTKLDSVLDGLDVRADGMVPDHDIAEALNWTEEEVRQFRAIPREGIYPESLVEWDALLGAPRDANTFEQTETERIVADALAELPERQADVIRMRFGIGRDAAMTLEEIGQLYGVTRERIRQIEAKGLDRLAHPGRKRRLQELLGI